MAKLTDTQLIILSTAARRDDRAILPLAKALKLNPGSMATVLKGLLAKQLVVERPAGADEESWRTEDDRRYTLTLSDAGFAALDGGGAPKTTAGISAKRSAKQAAKKPALKVGGKLERVIGLLTRVKGATITELQKLTGWQPHSIRAALTGLRKKGFTVSRTKSAKGVTTYTASRA